MSFTSQVVLKANISDVYYRTELYTKTETDNLISNINLANYYNKTEFDNLLNLNQVILSNMAGSGIDLLSNNHMRRVFGFDGIVVSIYLNLNDVNDPKTIIYKYLVVRCRTRLLV